MATLGRIRTTKSAIVDWLTESPERRSLLKILGYALLTRAALYVLGFLAVRFGHPQLPPRVRHGPMLTYGLSGWLRWDVGWYTSIVEEGYQFIPGKASNVAFLPGFSVLITVTRLVFKKTLVASLIAANAAFVAAVVVLWSWVKERAGLRAAERAVIFLLLYPLSFFLNTAYAEGLFFLSCALALRSADREQWVAAGVFACVACLTRPMGFFLVPAFGWALARSWRFGTWRGGIALAVALPCAGLAAFAAYLWARFGTPFAMLIAQRTGWNVEWSLPALRARTNVYQEMLDVFQLLVPVALIALCVRAWRRFGPVSGLYAVLAAALGVFLGGESAGREALAVVPVFGAAGLLDFGPVATVAIRVASLLLLLTFAYAFVIGRFMG